MNELAERNKFVKNFLQQFQGQDMNKILDSLLVIGADQIISNFKFSENLPDEINKASKKIQSYFQSEDSEYLKDEIISLREELNKLNIKLEHQINKQPSPNSLPTPQTKIPLPKQQFGSKDKPVPKIAFNHHHAHNPEQQMIEKIKLQNQKRIGRSSSASIVSNNQSEQKSNNNNYLKKKQQQEQQITLKVTEVIPQMQYPIKYTPKYHHLSGEQVQITTTCFSGQLSQNSQKWFYQNKQNNKQKKLIEKSALLECNLEKEEKGNQMKDKIQKKDNSDYNNVSSNFYRISQQSGSPEIHQVQSNSSHNQNLANNFQKSPNFSKKSDNIQNKINTGDSNQQTNIGNNMQIKCISQNLIDGNKKNQFNFDIQPSSNQNVLVGQISPKFNEIIANYHSNQEQKETRNDSFNNINNNYNTNNNSTVGKYDKTSSNKENSGGKQNYIRNKSIQNQTTYNLKTTQRNENASKSNNKFSPPTADSQQKSSATLNKSKKVYYDPRKMKRGELFNPSQRQENYKNVESKIRGDIREHKQNSRNYGQTIKPVVVHSFVQPPQEILTSSSTPFVHHSLQDYRNSYENNQNIPPLSNYEQSNFQKQHYYDYQQDILQKQQLEQTNNQYSNRYSMNEDSAQFEDRPRQINYNNTNMPLNKSRSYTATTAATSVPNNQSYYNNNSLQPYIQTSSHYNYYDKYNNIYDKSSSKKQYLNNNINNQYQQQNPLSDSIYNQEHIINSQQPSEYEQNKNEQRQFGQSPSKITIDGSQQDIYKNRKSQQKQEYGGDQTEEIDPIIHEGENNSFIQDNSNRQIHMSQYSPFGENNQHYQQQNLPAAINDSINNRSCFNFNPSSMQQPNLKSNNQSISAHHNYQNDIYDLPPSQIQQEERKSNRTNNSFQDQSSILQYPYSNYGITRNRYQKNMTDNKIQVNNSFSQQNQQQTNQNYFQHFNQGIMNQSDNNIQNSFQPYNPTQNSYNFGRFDRFSYLDNDNQNKSGLIDDSINMQNSKNIARQSTNIYEQKYKEMVQQNRLPEGQISTIGNSQQLRYSDQQIQNQSDIFIQPSYKNTVMYSNSRINKSFDKYDGLKASNSEFIQNSNNYQYSNAVQNSNNALNFNQRSQIISDRSINQSNIKNKVNQQRGSPEIECHFNNYNEPNYQNEEKSLSQNNKYQNVYSNSKQSYSIQEELAQSDKYQLSASENKQPVEQKYKQQYQGQNQYFDQQNQSHSLLKHQPQQQQQQQSPQEYQQKQQVYLENAQLQHETFTNRQENMSDYSISSRGPQSPPLRIQYSGEGSTEGEHFTPFVISEKGKQVFQDDKLFFKDSQQQSQTMRSEY